MSNKPKSTRAPRGDRSTRRAPYCGIHNVLRSVCMRNNMDCLGLVTSEDDDSYYMGLALDGIVDEQVERDERGDPFQPEAPIWTEEGIADMHYLGQITGLS